MTGKGIININYSVFLGKQHGISVPVLTEEEAASSQRYEYHQ
jgi:hypothetical protein